MPAANVRGMYLLRTAAAAVFALALAACESPPVTWHAPVPALAGDSAGARLAVDSSGAVAVLPPVPAPRTIPQEPMCPGSLRFAWASGAEVYAAWWTPRPDSSLVLRASYSADSGATWKPSVPADTSDTDHNGCAHIAPAIAASGDYVHLAYTVRAAEGAGVFFAHSMDHAGMFHSPVPIVYGDRLTRAAIAADGDHVAIAYEDPNTSPTAIGLALSRTMGHLFEMHTMVSDGPGVGTHPRVAIRGHAVAVSWRATPTGDTTAVRAHRLLRTATFR